MSTETTSVSFNFLQTYLQFDEPRPVFMGSNASLVTPFSSTYGFSGEACFYVDQGYRLNFECSIYSTCCHAPLRFNFDLDVEPYRLRAFDYFGETGKDTSWVRCSACDAVCPLASALEASQYFDSRGAFHCDSITKLAQELPAWFDFVYCNVPGNDVLEPPLLADDFMTPFRQIYGSLVPQWLNVSLEIENMLNEAKREFREESQANLPPGASVLDTWQNIDGELEEVGADLLSDLIPVIEDKFVNVMKSALAQPRHSE